MAIDFEQLKNWKFDPIESRYEARDTIFYALSVGLGSDPLDLDQLRFVYEKELKALPTLATVIGSPHFWLDDPATGVTWQRVLFGEQSIEMHAPLDPTGHVIGQTWVDDIVDKGPKGAMLYEHRTVTDAQSGRKLCTLTSTFVCRDDGGFGGPSREARPAHRIPDREPDMHCDLPISPRLHLLYRLHGDLTPGHVDPEIARSRGFGRPILHGPCTFGIAGHAMLKSVCGYEPARLRKMAMRFTALVYPGDIIRTEIWRESPGRASFRCRVVDRDSTVVNNGSFAFDE